MAMPDLQKFIAQIQNKEMLEGDADLRNEFRYRFHTELALVVLMLNDIGATGGECPMHPSPPEKCDLCGTALEKKEFFVDGQTQSGTWANMCKGCYEKHGMGIGWGTGQLYRNRGLYGWQCIAGGNTNSYED
jgi:hypothetical protein